MEDRGRISGRLAGHASFWRPLKPVFFVQGIVSGRQLLVHLSEIACMRDVWLDEYRHCAKELRSSFDSQNMNHADIADGPPLAYALRADVSSPAVHPVHEAHIRLVWSLCV